MRRSLTRARTLLLQVKVPHADLAEETFSTLLGDVIEPRREFIQANALEVANLDVSPPAYQQFTGLTDYGCAVDEVITLFLALSTRRSTNPPAASPDPPDSLGAARVDWL